MYSSVNGGSSLQVALSPNCRIRRSLTSAAKKEKETKNTHNTRTPCLEVYVRPLHLAVACIALLLLLLLLRAVGLDVVDDEAPAVGAVALIFGVVAVEQAVVVAEGSGSCCARESSAGGVLGGLVVSLEDGRP